MWIPLNFIKLVFPCWKNFTIMLCVLLLYSTYVNSFYLMAAHFQVWQDYISSCLRNVWKGNISDSFNTWLKACTCWFCYNFSFSEKYLVSVKGTNDGLQCAALVSGCTGFTPVLILQNQTTGFTKTLFLILSNNAVYFQKSAFFWSWCLMHCNFTTTTTANGSWLMAVKCTRSVTINTESLHNKIILY